MERFLSYDRLISSYRNRYDVPNFKEDKLYVAYLDGKYEQFWLHLVKKNLDLNMVKKVILECYNQLHKGEEIIKFAFQNPALFDTILNYMQHFKTEPEDPYKSYYDETRILASMCFKQFCKIGDVKEKLNVCKYIEDIYLSFDDDTEDVRINVYLGLLFFSQSRFGIDSLVQNKILEKIIKKLTEEKSLIVLNLILMLINEILNSQDAPKIALKNEILLNLKLFIDCEDLNVLENTINVYGSLAICEEGKKKCVEEGTIIINFLNKIESLVNENDFHQQKLKILIGCIRFLMQTSILKKGKVEIFENNGIDILFSVINENCAYSNYSQVILDVLQTIGNVSEEPRARKKLREEKYLNKVNEYMQSPDELIREQSQITNDIILWEP